MGLERVAGDGSASPAYAVRSAVGADLPAIVSLLESASLPTVGVADWLSRFVVAESNGSVIGAAGIEVWPGGALLRSVAVSSEHEGKGLGSLLVARALDGARAAGVRAVYLLTTTAEQYFPRYGFERTERSAVPEGVRESVEFREACPDSATVMVLRLDSTADPGGDCC